MDVALGLTALLALGMAAQWLAWRIQLPAILLLLVLGFFAGPEFLDLGFHDLLRDTLLPLVGVAVGLILFEGGLTLDMRDMRAHGRVVWRLITLGALVTWVLGTLAAHYVAGLGFELSLLLGAILVVSGPTVVLPLLRHINPRGRSGPILTWEGIAIDPVGAVLALLVFEGLVSPGGWGGDTQHALLGLLRTAAVGGIVGLAGGWILVRLLRGYHVPDHLQIPVTVAMVVAAFTGSNALQHESGLLTVTLMGVYAANQHHVSVRHILEFKENLRVLLLSSLFLLLASQLRTSDIALLDWRAFAFLAVLLFVVRPAAVWVSTRGSKLTREECIFLAWLCPRGIVAAAVASVFGFDLASKGFAGAERLVPMTFLVIVGTVIVYGLTSGPLARRLGLAIQNPQGVLFIGAAAWAREMAAALQAEDIPVMLVDTNRRNVREARLSGLPARAGDALDESVAEGLDLFGIGQVLALTPNDEINTLVTLHFAHDFGRSRTYRLATDKLASGKGAGPAAGTAPLPGAGRVLFAESADYYDLSARFARGSVRVTALTEVFGYEDFLAEHGERLLPLFAIASDGSLSVATIQKPLAPGPGARVIALVDEGSSKAPPRPPAAPPAAS